MAEVNELSPGDGRQQRAAFCAPRAATWFMNLRGDELLGSQALDEVARLHHRASWQVSRSRHHVHQVPPTSGALDAVLAQEEPGSAADGDDGERGDDASDDAQTPLGLLRLLHHVSIASIQGASTAHCERKRLYVSSFTAHFCRRACLRSAAGNEHLEPSSGSSSETYPRGE